MLQGVARLANYVPCLGQRFIQALTARIVYSDATVAVGVPRRNQVVRARLFARDDLDVAVSPPYEILYLAKINARVPRVSRDVFEHLAHVDPEVCIAGGKGVDVG